MTTSTTKHTASPEAVWNEDIAEAIHDSVRKHKGVPSYGTIARDLLAKFPVIAAAPELLSAIVDLLDACPTSCEDRRLNDAQRAAEQLIAKVNGGD